jgi:ketosteroid isomerase-like protein
MQTQMTIAALFTGLSLLWPPESARAQGNPTLGETAVAWTATFRTQDAGAIAGYFSEDVVAYYPGWDRPVLGRTASQETWARYFSRRPHLPMSVDAVTVSESEDLGYVLGQWLYAAENDPEATGGRYVAVWRRIGGQWKIVALSAHNHADVTSATFRGDPPRR